MHFFRVEFFDLHDSIFENEFVDYRVFENFQKIKFLIIYDKSQ